MLPLFLATFGGGAAALGVIEGFSDAGSSLLKLWMSFYSDRVGRRKPILAVGYLVTALTGLFGLVTAWWQILVVRMIAWIGRGARGPVRDALLSESVPEEAHGRAFGFETAMDTLGAIIGPAIALSLVGVIALRRIFLIAFIPGAITVLIVLFVLRDIPRAPQPHIRMLASLRDLPRPFHRYVAAVGVFGLGNFAHTLLVLRAVAILTPVHGAATAGRWAIGLYIFHNVVYAGASYPAGWLGDRIDKKLLLAVGYALFGDSLHRLPRRRCQRDRPRSLSSAWRVSTSRSSTAWNAPSPPISSRSRDAGPATGRSRRSILSETCSRASSSGSCGVTCRSPPVSGTPPCSRSWARWRFSRPDSGRSRKEFLPMGTELHGLGRSDTGRVRRRDEDALLVDEDNAIFAVADGVGGHRAGEIASQIAVQTLARVVAGARRQTAFSPASALTMAFSQANEEINLYAVAQPEARGLATTLVAFLGLSTFGVVAHIGDSRAYLLRDRFLTPLTRDHSALSELARSDPGIDLATLRKSRLAHILTRSLGGDGDSAPDLATIDVEPGDRILLCCDGLTDMVAESEIERILSSILDREACATALIDTANSAGGEDNITVLVIDAEVVE